MTLVAHDIAQRRFRSGLAFAMLAAVSFGLSGTLAKGLMDTGWSAGGAVLARVVIAASVLAVPGIVALRGQWRHLRTAIGSIVAYGVFAVAGAQLFYFMAVATLDVSIALLIEYLAPVAVVLWLWLRHGNRPTRMTVVGAAIAAIGLALLLNVIGGGAISMVGVGWALLAMVGASVYFIISGDASNPLPPITLAAAGLAVAALLLAIAGLTGILPLAFAAGDVVLKPFSLPAWLAIAVLGVVSAAVAYVAGIAATRRLGARVGSFVALSEVIAAAIIALVLLGQAPAPVQIAGAFLVLAGVVVVKVGERTVAPVVIATTQPLPLASDAVVGDGGEPMPVEPRNSVPAIVPSTL